jgi:hypothetical protein
MVEKTPDGIIYRAAKTYPVPNVDVLTLLFGKCSLGCMVESQLSQSKETSG